VLPLRITVRFRCSNSDHVATKALPDDNSYWFSRIRVDRDGLCFQAGLRDLKMKSWPRHKRRRYDRLRGVAVTTYLKYVLYYR
jgi:hypothetical protein